MHAIRLNSVGGPEALEFETIDKPTPGNGDLLIQVEAAGVNFIDIYYRTGLYRSQLPITMGFEGSGTVVATGDCVSEFKAGDRVAWPLALGSYAQHAIVPEAKAVRIPDSIDFSTAAGSMVQGTTAHYLTHDTYPIKLGDPVLVHAAAGGTGLLIVQMAKRRGAHVIATVSTKPKAALAKRMGADEVIIYTEVDFQKSVRHLTDGIGVACVYDSVGRTTFDKSLACLRPLGMLVLCGTSSGPVPPFEIQKLSELGSLFLTRPNGFTYTADRNDLLRHSNAVFDGIRSGWLQISVERTYSLADAAIAHSDLESRRTTGKLLLRP